tara:strand:- start:171 stop:461 length:291 start_codon:yes stop_codon:yes gene_type:complete
LWEYLQESEYFSGKTTFIITTDHGRGTTPLDSWRSHGTDIKGSDQTWIIAFRKRITPAGEMSNQATHFNNQIAPTIRELTGLEQTDTKGYGTPIKF